MKTRTKLWRWKQCFCEPAKCNYETQLWNHFFCESVKCNYQTKLWNKNFFVDLPGAITKPNYETKFFLRICQVQLQNQTMKLPNQTMKPCFRWKKTMPATARHFSLFARTFSFCSIFLSLHSGDNDNFFFHFGRDELKKNCCQWIRHAWGHPIRTIFFEIYRNIDILCFQLEWDQLEWETTFSFTTDTVKISKFSLNLWIFSGTVPKKIQKYRWQSIYVYFWIVFFTVHSFVKILNFSLFQCCINYKGNSGLSKC